jgi:hypothetical protein
VGVNPCHTLRGTSNTRAAPQPMSSASSLNSDLCRFLSVIIAYNRLAHSAIPVIFPWYATSSVFGPFFLFRANRPLISFIVVLRSGCAIFYYMLGALTLSSYLTGTTFFYCILESQLFLWPRIILGREHTVSLQKPGRDNIGCHGNWNVTTSATQSHKSRV